jgi:hypothetical protein
MRKLLFIASALLTPAIAFGASPLTQYLKAEAGLGTPSMKVEAAPLALQVVGGWYSQAPSVWYKSTQGAVGSIGVSGNQIVVNAQLCSDTNCRTIDDAFYVVKLNPDDSILISRGNGDKLFTLRDDGTALKGNTAISILSERSSRSGYVLYIAGSPAAASDAGGEK